MNAETLNTAVNEKCSPELLLSVRGLRVEFETDNGSVEVVHGVDLDVPKGTTVGLVGESGSGKSVSALSLLGMLPVGGRVAGGEVCWDGKLISAEDRAGLCGREITLINQEPMSTLDPLMTVGRQLVHVLRRHAGMNRRASWTRAVELFEMVGIPEPDRRLRQYPWQFSGGMAQRVVIALALAPEPTLLVADEPTTALDVTIQAQILGVIAELQAELDLSVLMITHDLGVVAGVASEIAVMYAGRVCETGSTADIFRRPSHPYTQGLLDATPNPRGRAEVLDPNSRQSSRPGDH